MMIEINEADWDARGIKAEKFGDVYRFHIPGYAGVVVVRIEDNKLRFAKDRSSGHRALISALGLAA